MKFEDLKINKIVYFSHIYKYNKSIYFLKGKVVSIDNEEKEFVIEFFKIFVSTSEKIRTLHAKEDDINEGLITDNFSDAARQTIKLLLDGG